MTNRPHVSDRCSRRDIAHKKPEEWERYNRRKGALKAETQGRDAMGMVHSVRSLARVTSRNCSGCRRSAKAMKSSLSCW